MIVTGVLSRGASRLWLLVSLCLLPALLFIFPGNLSAQMSDREKELRQIVVTRWMDDQGREPVSYDEWKARTGEFGPFAFEKRAGMAPDKQSTADNLFCILVNSDLFAGIETALTQYMADLVNDGYTVESYTLSGGTPESIRSFLAGLYAQGMVGAVLIGDLPVPWYESYCWDPKEHETFPCDLYYMDLDGIWEDIDANGIFDDHYGDISPEIWVGRLTASPLTYNGATEVSLLLNYFEKNHRYRTGQLMLSDRALVFIDDDWAGSAGSWSGEVGEAYDERVTVSDLYETVAPNYATRLTEEYEAVLVCAHSSPYTHWFKYPTENWTTIDYDEIVDLDPVAIFYNLFACSNARYIESNYMAGWYIFCQSYGLASVGSTKTGSMLDFHYFYYPFGNGYSIGESFRRWFDYILNDGAEPEEVCWFYGMTLCGDPTLVRHMHSAPAITTIDLAPADYGSYYECTMAATGGQPPYQWELIGGELPKDLELDPATGCISGVVAEFGTYYPVIEMTDAGVFPRSDTAYFSLSVNFICGDANTDGLTNVADAVYLINYVFKSGPAPMPLEAGDANCDGNPNVGDCVYIINYVFSGGPEPCCPN